MPSATKVQTGYLEAVNPFAVAPGTASAPTLTFTDSSATGMFSPSTGVLAFSTGSTQNALTILADGRVGIGNTNPDKKFVVNGSGGNFISEFYNTNDAPSNNGVYIRTLNASSTTYALAVNSGTNGSNQLLLVRSDGNVGVGTTNPTEKLHVAGTIAAIGNGVTNILSYDLDGVVGTMSSHALKFFTSGNEKVRISSGGYVGIGITNPGSKLDVYNDSNDGNVARIYNDEVGLAIGSWGDGSTYPRTVTINGSRFDQLEPLPKLRIAGQGGIEFAVDLNSVRAVIDSSGNVGIGTTNPNSKIQVHNGDVYLSGTSAIMMDFDDNVEEPIIKSTQNDGYRPYITWRRSGGTSERGLKISTFNNIGTRTDWLHIRNGSFGLNYDQPLTMLHAHTGGSTIVNGNAEKYNTMQGITLTNANNDDTSVGLWIGTDTNHWCGISGQRSNSATGWGTDLRFYTHENNSVDLTTTRERVRITSEGNVGIGITNPPGDIKLFVNNGIARVQRNINSNDYINVVQHSGHFQIGRVDDNKSLEFAVLQNGTSVIQSKEAGVGYNNLVLQINSNVGIGATTPAYKLTVAGSGRASNWINAVGNIINSNYTPSSAWNTGWATVVPAGSLTPGNVYLFRAYWSWNGGAVYTPWDVFTSFLFCPASTNSGGFAGSVYTPMNSSHVGGNYIMSFRPIAGSPHISAGLEVNFNWNPGSQSAFYIAANVICF